MNSQGMGNVAGDILEPHMQFGKGSLLSWLIICHFSI